MKEIYLLNKGDSVEKVKHELNLTGEYSISHEKVFGYNYVETKKGIDDIVIVKNYLPNYIYKVKKNETIMDILSRGFMVTGVENISAGDTIVLSKPKSIRYVVKPLETLEEISRNFGIDKETIMSINDLKSNKLFIGQILWL